MSRVFFIAVAGFWLTMNVLLWQTEFGSRKSSGAVPVEVVWEKILTAADDSSLTVFHEGKLVGAFHMQTQVGEKWSKVSEVERFNLEAFANKMIEGLSHGTKQRVAIVSALLHEPEIFVIDEPMVGLDPHHARVVKDILRERSRAGVTVVVSTHQLSVADEMADRIGIIHGGRLIAVGTRDELRRQSGTSGPLEEAFLSLTAQEPGQAKIIY